MSAFIIIALLCLNFAYFASRELQCDNAELEECQETVKMKDEQIQNLTVELIQLMVQGKSTNTSIDTQLNHVLTCNDVDKRLHLRWKNQCIHQCVTPHACSDGILSCYPYENCIIQCLGPASCHNLQIDFLSGSSKLQCDGFNSCKDITMNCVKQYKYDNIHIQHHLHEPYKPQYEQQFSWFIPDFTFDLENITEFTDSDDITINKHYILVKDVLPKDILNKIRKSHKKCLNIKRNNHTEHREFGVFGYKYDMDVTGHSVTFMDDCLHTDVYAFIKSVTMGILKYFQQYTINALQSLNISKEDKHGIMQFIADNWLYDWQKLIGLANDLESRVIEYILYSHNGNLGFHTDDESNITVVTMLNDETSFDGGISMFRMNGKDKDEHHIKMSKNDIIMFPSIADHGISPIINGERHVLVFEWWNLGRSTSVGRVLPSEHLKERKRKKMARKRLKNRKHWSQLF